MPVAYIRVVHGESGWSYLYLEDREPQKHLLTQMGCVKKERSSISPRFLTQETGTREALYVFSVIQGPYFTYPPTVGQILMKVKIQQHGYPCGATLCWRKNRKGVLFSCLHPQGWPLSLAPILLSVLTSLSPE